MWLLSVLCVCLYSIYGGCWMIYEVKHKKYDKYVSKHSKNQDILQQTSHKLHQQPNIYRLNTKHAICGGKILCALCWRRDVGQLMQLICG